MCVYMVVLLYVCLCGGQCYRCVYVVSIAMGVSIWWTLL